MIGHNNDRSITCIQPHLETLSNLNDQKQQWLMKPGTVTVCHILSSGPALEQLNNWYVET